MKKLFLTFSLTAGILASTTILAFATQGSTVNIISGGSSYHGAVDGSVNSNGCYAETKAHRDSGTDNTYAYVEIVNGGGYRIGSGAQSTGVDYACSPTLSHGDGHNAYGSIGNASGTIRAFCHLL